MFPYVITVAMTQKSHTKTAYKGGRPSAKDRAIWQAVDSQGLLAEQ